MIMLDTNVLSALMQQQPDPQVVSWLDDQPAESIWISSITLFEARYGLALLASGQRKSMLEKRFKQLLQDDLENRVLLFDDNAATQAAQLAAERKVQGRHKHPPCWLNQKAACLAPLKKSNVIRIKG